MEYEQKSRSQGRATSALAGLLLLGCGSERLETAVIPAGPDYNHAGTAPSGGRGGGPSGADGGGAPAPVQTEVLVGFDDFSANYLVGPLNGERFQLSGQPFTQAWRATVAEPPSSPWVAQLVVPVPKPVAAGQLLHVSFWLDCEAPGDSGDCYTECIFERSSDPWEKSVTFVAHGSEGWAQKSEFFSAVDDYEASGSQLVFRLGYAKQVIALGGIELEAIGP